MVPVSTEHSKSLWSLVMDQSLTSISDAKSPMSIAALHVVPCTLATRGATSNSPMATPTRIQELRVSSTALTLAKSAKTQEAPIVGAQAILKGEFMKYSFLAGLVFYILCSSVFAREVTVTVPDEVTFSSCFVRKFEKCEEKDQNVNCIKTGYYYGLFGVSEFGTETIKMDRYGTRDLFGGTNQIADSYHEVKEQVASLREMYQLGQALRKKGICNGIEILH
jgi:hypothetical protein